MANYYGNRGNGSSMRHYRTKGSRNGYSKDPNYKPVGQQAQGKIVNGRYVYDNPNTWQQTANKTAAAYRAVNAYSKGQVRKVDFGSEKNVSEGDARVLNSRFDRAVNKRDAAEAARRNGEDNNWQQKANAAAGLYNTMNRVASGTSNYAHLGSTKNFSRGDLNVASAREKTIVEKRARKGSTGLNMNSVHNAQTERARHEAFDSAAKGIAGGVIKNRDKIAKGLAKNIQDKIRTANPYGEQKNVGGAMRNDPRYSSNSVIGTVSGNMNKQELAAIGSTVKGAYNKIAHPIDRQVNKIKGTAAKATREVKKTASNVVNKGKATVDSLLKKFKKKK